MPRLLLSCLFAALVAGSALAEEASPTRWSLDAGLGVRLWSNAGVPEAEREYLEQGRVGWVYGLDVSAYPWEHWGFGVLHGQFSASASASNVTFVDKSQGDARNDYRIFYTAPALYATRALGEKFRLTGNAGAGIFFYHDEAKAGAFPGVLEGSALGLHAAGSFDVKIARRVAVGLGARFLYGELETFRYNGIETSTTPLSLTRLDFIAGVRLYP